MYGRGYSDRDYEDIDDGYGFADPGGRSALRASLSAGGRCACGQRLARADRFCRKCGRHTNPRVHPCPDCGRKDVLTDEDVRKGYCCDRCADRKEGHGYHWDY